MRRVATHIALGVLLLLTACNHTRWNILGSKTEQRQEPAAEAPSVSALVDYLNSNSQRLQTMRCEDLDLTCSQGLQSVTLRGKMLCQQPRNFNMRAEVLGNMEVELGSNSDEFWYWIRRGDPYQIHCSYKDLSEGKVRRMPFPFQPDWVLETLGMSNYGPADRYQMIEEPEVVKLVEKTRSPQGNMVRKVIIIRRRPAQAPNPQVTDFLLLDDATGKEICAAHVYQTQIDRTTGGLLPRRIELRWPEQKLKLSMKLDTVTANLTIPPNAPAFVRRPMQGVPGFDLASGRMDGQPSSLQQAGFKARRDGER